MKTQQMRKKAKKHEGGGRQSTPAAGGKLQKEEKHKRKRRGSEVSDEAQKELEALEETEERDIRQTSRPKKAEKPRKNLEAADGRERQTRPDGEPLMEEKQKSKRPRRSREADRELEATEGMESNPSSGDLPVEGNVRRRSDRFKKPDNGSEEAKSEGKQGTASGGLQESHDRLRRSRGKSGGEQMPAKHKSTATPTGRKKGDPKTPANNKSTPTPTGRKKGDTKTLDSNKSTSTPTARKKGDIKTLDSNKSTSTPTGRKKGDTKTPATNKGSSTPTGRKKADTKTLATNKSSSTPAGRKKDDTKPSAPTPKMAKRQYVSDMVVDGIEFQVGDDVYVRKSDGDCSESDSEVEDCRICGSTNEEIMLECDDCLAGFHLTCLSPPLENVPEDDWICPYCEKGEPPPRPSTSQRRHRSARERLLACDLWAARITRMWKEIDGTTWFSAHWFIVPEETSLGRQPHNGRRELFRSNRADDNEMDSIVRHCYVMSPTDYKNSTCEGDDVFFCEYEYNEQWCKFKRIEYLDDNENWSEDDQPFEASDESEEDGNADKPGGRKRRRSVQGKRLQSSKSIKAANKRHNYSRGIEEVGAKTIPDGVRKRPQTDIDRAKAALALSAVPPSLPCRDRERKEISAFLRDSVGAGEHCLGRCLYISGVPGTGKTATVLEVIKELGSKVELGELPPYRFVEINGLRLPSPEHAYTILHEALTGQHVGWKRALQYLDERFSKNEPGKGVDSRPTVLLVDELDLLVTRNQSVLYNIFDWPTRPQSRLVIIGIANTMDLPERMLPRIASRMGMHRISFSPYSHKQLEEIISARLIGVEIFDKQAAEFASRKVAAVSGDTRRALELCRRAVEVAEARVKLQSSSLPSPPSNDPSSNGVTSTTQGHQANGPSVILADVDAAISEMFEAPQILMMKRSAKFAKIFLVAMVYEQRRTSMAETTFEKVATTCSELCTSNGEEKPDWDTLLTVGCKLGACRLLLCEPGAQHRLQKLQLNFPCDDVSFALKEDEESPWLAKYL